MKPDIYALLELALLSDDPVRLAEKYMNDFQVHRLLFFVQQHIVARIG